MSSAPFVRGASLNKIVNIKRSHVMEKVKTLIVEDEIIVARDLQRHLEKMGHTVTSIVPSGEQAIEKIENEIPGLVLMDIVLQERMDGIETAEIIRSRFDIPVVFLTANGDKATFERAKNVEPLGYIVKPFKGEELRRVIEIALFRHKAEQKREALAREQRKGLNGLLKKLIIKHRHTESVLKESEQKIHKFTHAVEQSSNAVVITDVKGNIEYVNPGFTQMTGYTSEEAMGLNPRILKTDKTPPEEFNRLWKTISSGSEWSGEFCNKKKNGELFWECASISPVKDKEGVITNYIAVKEDVTEHRRIEEALRLSKEQMQSILDNTTSVIYLKNLQGKYIFINRQYQDLFHITKEEIVGKTDYDIFPGEMADAFRANDQKVIKARAPLEMEEVALHDDGPHTYISIKFPLFDSNGTLYGVCGVSTDITDRVKSKEALQEQKESLEQKNIALGEVLGQIEIEKRQIEENVIANAENLLLPTIQKLGLAGESHKYVQLLQKNLEELTSSFGSRLTDKKTRLTSREIEICNMIKNGLASKEIARLLNTSLLTVEKHRNNIRSKLGVVNKGLSLFSVLQEL